MINFEVFFRDQRTACLTDSGLQGFARLPDWVLVRILGTFTGAGIELIIRIIDQPDRDRGELFEQARSTLEKLDARHLELLFDRCRSLEALEILVFAQTSASEAFRVLRGGLDTKSISALMLGMDSAWREAEDVATLAKKLLVDRISSYGAAEDGDDLRGEAFAAAFKWRHDVEAICATVIPNELFPPLPPEAGIAPLDPRRWHAGRLQSAVMRTLVGRLDAVFSGELERVPEKAHQHLRDHFEKRVADKRTAPEFNTELKRRGAWSECDATERVAFREAVASLSPQERKVFALLQVHEPDEVARLLRISSATVGVVTHRIKKKFSL